MVSVFVVAPDVPRTAIWELPAPRGAAFTVTFAAAGNTFTEAGLMPQLPLPEIREHDKVTVPINPFKEPTLIGPSVVVLPALTVGKRFDSVRQKPGLLSVRGKLNCHNPRP